MKVRDMIILLEEFADNYGEDTDVVIVHQENYPIRESVQGIAPPYDTQDVLDEVHAANPGISVEDALEIAAEDNGPLEITIVAGGHPDSGSPYGDRDVWDRSER